MSGHHSSLLCGPDSSVVIVKENGLEGPGIESQWGEIFLLSRPALMPTDPPVQWVSSLSPGVKYGRGLLLINVVLED